MSHMKIAVTGGSGFLGQATIRAAENAGHEAWAFDRTQGLDILGSLDALNGADTVIHLAGMLGTSELFDTPEQAVDVNIKGALRILQWCRDHNAAYVGITMPDVYPSVYTATKICAQRLATAWHLAYGVPVSHVRAFNAYGPGSSVNAPGYPKKIVPTFARAAWSGKPIPVMGDGKQIVDLIHTDDIARMLLDATRHGDDAMFEAGTGQSVTVHEVAERILDVTGSTAGIEYMPMRRGETPTQVVATGEGWDRLDWRPRMDWDRFAEAVRSYR
jgi:UDP-glucose 4-epimerase